MCSTRRACCRGGENKEDDSQPKKRRPAQDQNMDTTEKGGQTHPQQSGDNAHMALNRGPPAATAKEADQASSLVRPKTPKHGYDGSMRAGKTKMVHTAFSGRHFLPHRIQ